MISPQQFIIQVSYGLYIQSVTTVPGGESSRSLHNNSASVSTTFCKNIEPKERRGETMSELRGFIPELGPFHLHILIEKEPSVFI